MDSRSYNEQHAPVPTDEDIELATALLASGYLRTSWKHRQVSRIDRADWVAVLARELRRAPADFYVPGDDLPAGNWADHYRRVYSNDHVTVSHAVIALVPTSNWNKTGYVEVSDESKGVIRRNVNPTEGERGTATRAEARDYDQASHQAGRV